MTPDPSSLPPPPPRPTHKLTVYELDKGRAKEAGINPLQITVITVPHQVTAPLREAAAERLVEQHTGRRAIEINHCPGGDMTAFVLKG